MIKKNNKIFFVYPVLLPYIKTDFEIFNQYFNVKVFLYKGFRKDFTTFLKMIQGVIWSNFIISYFADTHTFFLVFLSKILRKKIIVIPTGYETANIPKIKYGAMINSYGLNKIKVKFILKFADKIIANSQFHKQEILKYTTTKNIEQIYWSIDIDKFKDRKKRKNKNLIITVGTVNNINLKRKGLKTFVESARYLPDLKFALIGKHIDDSIKYLKSIAPSNVSFKGFISEKELIELYQDAKVYCQLSLHEIFGVSLAEAMSCECVPVVTNQGALYEVVGDSGFYVPYKNPRATSKAIKKALNSYKGKSARARIRKEFCLKIRKEKLFSLIHEI